MLCAELPSQYVLNLKQLVPLSLDAVLQFGAYLLLYINLLLLLLSNSLSQLQVLMSRRLQVSLHLCKQSLHLAHLSFNIILLLSVFPLNNLKVLSRALFEMFCMPERIFNRSMVLGESTLHSTGSVKELEVLSLLMDDSALALGQVIRDGMDFVQCLFAHGIYVELAYLSFDVRELGVFFSS